MHIGQEYWNQKRNLTLERVCYNSYAHNIHLLKQDVVSKQKNLLNNPSKITVWQPVERLKIQQKDISLIRRFTGPSDQGKLGFRWEINNNRCFQTMARIRKQQNAIWKIKYEQGTGLMTRRHFATNYKRVS